MMSAINLKPEKIFEEATLYGQKLAAGIENLKNVGEISAGVSPTEVVYEEDKLKLRHYLPLNGKKPTNKTPLLVVYALVNRPYMTDIQEDRSTIMGLMEAGQDVYLIDWGYPDRADRFLTLDDYINGYIDRCVDAICERHGINKINILGICQGGAFSLCYTATHQDKINSIVTMVTPVDFKTDTNLLSKWIQKVDVDALVDAMGNISGNDLNTTFLNMSPYSLMMAKYVDMVDTMDDPVGLKNFLRMEKWIFDSPNQAGEAYRQFMKDFFQENKLVKGEVVIGDKQVKLSNIKCPVLNVYAEKDQQVPPSASIVLKDLVGTKDYTEETFKGGHIGVYVSGRAHTQIPPAIGNWLSSKSK